MAFLNLINRIGDVITGTNSADVIDVRSASGIAATTVSGGNGNDVYYVDGELNFAGAPPDSIIELAGGGTDTVNVRMHQYNSGSPSGNLSFTLANNVENLNVSATNNLESSKYSFSLFGNSSANVITASTTSSNNQFSIDGGAGNDKLTSSFGNDTLRGGSGTNVLIGGSGDDVYYVDGTDTIIELISGGDDEVISSRTFTLAANVENLELVQLGGMVGLNGTGNALNNIIRGTENHNVLNGGSNGNDVLYGNMGNDTLIGGNESDTVSGGDSLFGGDGNDKLDGGSGKDTLDGGVGSDTLLGGTGSDVLDAGVDTEADSLDGGAGNDTFLNIREADIVRDTGVGGIDTIYIAQNTMVGYVLGVGIENAYLNDGVEASSVSGNSLSNILVGNESNNTLIGNAGNDTLDGGAGADLLFGGLGNDNYYIDDIGDSIVEEPESGTDTVHYKYFISDGTVAIDESIENATLTEFSGNSSVAGNLTDNKLIGNSYANILRGLAGKDTLDGSAGNDTLYGGSGDDTYYVDSEDDIVQEEGGLASGVDLVYSSSSYYELNANVENATLLPTIDGGTLIGNISNNILKGNDGNNTLGGAGGTDKLFGGKGNDTYKYALGTTITEAANQGTDTIETDVSNIAATSTFSIASIANIENILATGAESFNLTGNAINNRIIGNSGDNIINGGAGNDTLFGNGGVDMFIGGAGNDTYVVDSASDTVTELANGGTDTIIFQYEASVHYLTEEFAQFEHAELGADAGESLLYGNEKANNLKGNASAQFIESFKGSDTIDGGGGADHLFGGVGDDTYIINNDGVYINDTDDEELGGNAGTDVIISSLETTSLASFLGVENLTLAEGAGVLEGFGNSANNIITGNSTANTLNGGTGRDTLIGGAGDDRYFFFDDVTDIVIEKASQGNDTVVTNNSSIKTISIAAFANVENLIVSLAGGNGVDVYTATGNTGNNEIRGASGFRNSISGGAGNDTLLGGNLIDTLNGGAGNDFYRVSAVAGNIIDTVIEAANGGTDTINLDDYDISGSNDVNVTIAANIENAEITQSGLIANFIGNISNNRLTGADGTDTLNGGVGNDTLIGNAGDDSLIGGAGNDTYFYQSGDTIVELIAGAAGGKDTVVSNTEIFIDLNTATFTNIENITLQGEFDNLLARGNAGANSIMGSNGSDYLEGMAGNDTLIGGEGNDIFFGGSDSLASALGVDSMVGGNGNDHYMVDVAGDKVIELADGGTFDTVASYVTYTLGANVEHLILKNERGDNPAQLNINGTGNASNNIIQGGGGNNVINGGAGNDTISGGFGIDSLTGGAGNDTFVLNSIGVEKILDFTLGQDKLTLNATGFIYSNDFTRVEENFSAFSGLTFNGINNSLSTSLFSLGTIAVGDSATNYIQYDIKTGNLYYDVDGGGETSAVQIAEFKDGTAIFATDIFEYFIPT